MGWVGLLEKLWEKHDSVVMNHLLPKFRFFLVSVLFQTVYGSNFKHFDVVGPSEIAQNKGHYAIQSHSRSPILVPMKSRCATFLLMNNSNIHPISHRVQNIAE